MKPAEAMSPFQGKAGGLNRMKYRKLRIAWSVAWGLLAVLVCVLWVRSYWHYDYVEGFIDRHPPFRIETTNGQVLYYYLPKTIMTRWFVGSQRVKPVLPKTIEQELEDMILNMEDDKHHGRFIAPVAGQYF